MALYGLCCSIAGLWGTNDPGSGALCEGDCDDDTECDVGLLCYQRDSEDEAVPGCGAGGQTTSSTWDYCYDPNAGSDMISYYYPC